ncbi:MAG: motif, partial [Pseudomonadota bacterium]
AELERAVAKHGGDLAQKQAEAKSLPPQKSAEAPAVRGADSCPCGSGKKFKDCHGGALDDDSAA